MPSIVNPAVSPGNLMPAQRDAMHKLLESQTFASSPRLREVLAHLIAALESGTAEQLSEQSIGHDVFGKTAGYNASEDNIVRVTIRHLRTRLDEYYHAEGQTDAWVIRIPKGKYVPLLVAADPIVIAASRSLPATDESQHHEIGHDSRNAGATSTRMLFWIVPFVLVIGLIGGFFLKAALAHPPALSGGILGQLCSVGDELSVVVVDSNVQIYRQVFHHQVTLDEYIHRSYAKEPLDSSDPRLADAQQLAIGADETNVSSAIVGAAVRQALDGRHVTIKHPHDISLREFQDQKSVILLGGPFINPWGQLFENRLNFRVLPRPTSPASSEIHNTKPQPGEPLEYIPHVDGNLTVNYVRIAILPNFENSGHVILVGATNADALEAAGTYLLSDESVTELEGLFHTHSVAALPALEFVLEVRGLNSVPNSYHIVSYRSVPLRDEH